MADLGEPAMLALSVVLVVLTILVVLVCDSGGGGGITGGGPKRFPGMYRFSPMWGKVGSPPPWA